MAVILRSLPEFKRFLAKPGATIQVVRNTFMDRQPEATRAAPTLAQPDASLVQPFLLPRDVSTNALVAGGAVFAVTLYAMALGAPRWLGAVTPIGGALLIGGWLWLGWRLRTG